MKEQSTATTAISRLEALHEAVDAILLPIEDAVWRRKFYVHLYGVSECAAFLAKKRGLNAELAAVAGMLHDISAATAGNYDDHCNLSAEQGQEILQKLGMFTEAEMKVVHQAIVNHDFRGQIDSPFDEVLKDADILHPHLNQITRPVGDKGRARLEAMYEELGL